MIVVVLVGWVGFGLVGETWRPTTSEMASTNVLYLKLSRNLTVVVIVSRHVSWGWLVDL